MRKVACAALLLVAVGGSAHAEEPAAPSPTQTDGAMVAVDIATTAVVGELDRGLGIALDGRLGYTFSGLPSFTPELSLGMFDVPEGELVGRAGGGGRLTLGKTVQPSLFAHGGGWWSETGGGPAGDVGLAVDFVLSREFSAGM